MTPIAVTPVALLLQAMQVVLGAALLGVIAFRFYDRRPQLDVPRTDEEIRAYKRTGKHPRASGFSGYHIVYGTPHPWLVARLVLSAAGLLAGSLALQRWGRHGAALGCTLGGVYLAALAALLLYEMRHGRHRRLARLLDALALPPTARVLVIETLHGLLGIAVARRLPGGRTDIVCPDLAAVEATRINLRRAGMASRAEAELVATRHGGYDAVLLEAPPRVEPPLAPLGKAAILSVHLGSFPGTWRAVAPGVGARLLALMTFGRIAPAGRWSG